MSAAIEIEESFIRLKLPRLSARCQRHTWSLGLSEGELVGRSRLSPQSGSLQLVAFCMQGVA